MDAGCGLWGGCLEWVVLCGVGVLGVCGLGMVVALEGGGWGGTPAERT